MGDEPHVFSIPQMVENTMSRQRKTNKEVSKVPFTSTVRPVLLMDDKTKINSVHIMEQLENQYNWSRQKLPY